jgi:hypothetical protein
MCHLIHNMLRTRTRIVLVCVVVAVIAAAGIFVYPMFSDYRGYSEVYSWQVELQGVMDEIAANGVKNGSLARSGEGKFVPMLSPAASDALITESGTIIVVGGRDQLVLVVTPTLTAGKVKWSCFAGPEKDRPRGCQR